LLANVLAYSSVEMLIGAKIGARAVAVHGSVTMITNNVGATKSCDSTLMTFGVIAVDSGAVAASLVHALTSAEDRANLFVTLFADSNSSLWSLPVLAGADASYLPTISTFSAYICGDGEVVSSKAECGSEDESDETGLSHTNKIILIVCLCVGVPLLGLCIFLLCKRAGTKSGYGTPTTAPRATV
jgi:hypothetical protein